jgi:TetR/AcrR family transcriptional regulator, transcriptional repressor of aconitase
MPTAIAETRKRLTRKESQAQTRARLIAVGREHFLQYGLGGSIAEKIAEEAGYSRGALYANFSGKEDLFLAVIQEQEARHFKTLDCILHNRQAPVKNRLRGFREALTDIVTNPEWIVLYSEFEAEALRCKKIRNCFLKLRQHTIRNGSHFLGELAHCSEVKLKMKPDEFLLTILSFSLGIAIHQKLMGSDDFRKSVRRMIRSLFDELLSVA